MLRPLLAYASALVLIVACSKSEDSEEEVPADAPPTVESNTTTTGEKKKKKGDPTVPGSETTSSGGTTEGTGPESTSGGPGPAPEPGNVSDKVDVTDVQITVNGEGRRYLLAVPKNYDANKAYPLIIALHGDGGSADSFLNDSRLTVATGDQAIVAFPDQSVDLFTTYQDNNDQRLISATISQIKKNRNIDAGKVWGFGYSKGAFMLNEMGCRKPGLFTAIAPMAGGAPQERDDEGNVSCPEAQSLAVFATMGTGDDIGGGEWQTDYWAGLAGCGGDRQPVAHGTAPASCEQYQSCDQPVVFCKVDGFGHWPLYPNAALDAWNWFNSL